MQNYRKEPPFSKKWGFLQHKTVLEFTFKNILTANITDIRLLCYGPTPKNKHFPNLH